MGERTWFFVEPGSERVWVLLSEITSVSGALFYIEVATDCRQQLPLEEGAMYAARKACGHSQALAMCSLATAQGEPNQ